MRAPDPAVLEPTVFELSSPGLRGYRLPPLDVPEVDPVAAFGEENVRRDPPALPELTEPEVVRHNAARAVLEGTDTADGFQLSGHAEMEFDGYLNVRLALRAERDADLSDCRLEIPLKPQFAAYLMGMGCKGGTRPERWEWKWDPKKHQDSVWVGNVDGGVQCKLKGPDYLWPLVNIHYHRRPLVMPKAWYNEGKGGCVVEAAGVDRVTIRAYGGPRRVQAGEELRFDFGLLVTPVKPLNAKAHWSQRYYHSGVPDPKAVAETGANVINIHHGNETNPFINYPFLTPDKVKAYTAKAHALGLKVKLYYTIRELSNHAAELWALRSLGQEIYADGPGGGHAWLVEHLGDHYSPAWHHPFPDGTWCASISQTGVSRWHNYYLEGLSRNPPQQVNGVTASSEERFAPRVFPPAARALRF